MAENRTSYERYCDLMAEMKCDQCDVQLTPVIDDQVDYCPLAFHCSSCNRIFGKDATFSEDDCVEENVILKSYLDAGELLTEPCQGGCGNDDINRFMFVKERGHLALHCMKCDHRKVMDNEENEVDWEDEAPIPCICGNKSLKHFNIQNDGGLIISHCLKCNEIVVSETELPTAEETNGTPSNRDRGKKNGSGKESDAGSGNGETPDFIGTNFRNWFSSISGWFRKSPQPNSRILKAKAMSECLHGQFGKVTGLERRGFMNICLTGTEVWNVLSDIADAQKKRARGEISQRQANRVYVERTVEGFSAVIGSLIGYYVIPLRMAEDLTGCTIGDLIGRNLGKFAAKRIRKA